MSLETRSRRCPICRHEIPREATADYAPFCSRRCRDADLSRWFNEEYTVPVESERVVKELLPEDESTSG